MTLKLIKFCLCEIILQFSKAFERFFFTRGNVAVMAKLKVLIWFDKNIIFPKLFWKYRSLFVFFINCTYIIPLIQNIVTIGALPLICWPVSIAKVYELTKEFNDLLPLIYIISCVRNYCCLILEFYVKLLLFFELF